MALVLWGLFWLSILLSLTGCTSGGIAKVIKAAANDPASVHLKFGTPWGAAEYDRTNPGTNSRPHELKDGILVK
jgi:hypothetical protein